jgi:heme oxygenase
MQRPRLARLRLATSEIHADLERFVERRGFFETADCYGDYLRRLHLFYRIFESGLGSSMLEWAASWRITERAAWLSRDLSALSLAPLALDHEAAAANRPFTERARVLGALYVLLGASLGARVLIEKTSRLPLPEGGGRYYLAQVGEAGQWPRFLNVLEADAAGPMDEVCRGAVDTFASIRECLSRGDPT